jgi:hypothetical protein
VSYVDPAAGWSVAYPAGWLRQPPRAGNIDFKDPLTGAFLRIGSVETANPSAIQDWRMYEISLRSDAPDYRRVRMDPGDGDDGSTQADWEFTYTYRGETVHVLDRGAVRNRHGYALYWHTSEARWATDEPLMWQLFATFRPGP